MKQRVGKAFMGSAKTWVGMDYTMLHYVNEIRFVINVNLQSKSNIYALKYIHW